VKEEGAWIMKRRDIMDEIEEISYEQAKVLSGGVI
jgi:hypothetical protein